MLGGPGLIPSQYTALAKDMRPGDRILLDDGMNATQDEEQSG